MHIVPRCNDSRVVHRVDRIVHLPCIPLGLDIFRYGTHRLLLDEQCWDGPIFFYVLDGKREEGLEKKSQENMCSVSRQTFSRQGKVKITPYIFLSPLPESCKV